MNRPQVIHWSNIPVVDDGDGAHPNDPVYDHRLLAEGDSWFTLGGIPTSNLLFSMKFNGFTVIVNCGTPGDTIKHMGQIASNPDLRKAMSQRFGYHWDAILLSGGGNDLIDDADDIIRRRPGSPADPAAYCNEAVLAQTLDRVTTGYRNIIAMRDADGSSCMGKPVITHTYDWVTPRNAPARFVFVPLLGPWLYPALKGARVPQERWNPVADYLLGRLRDAIKSLATGPGRLPNFHVVTTQGTLQRAAAGSTQDSGDWLNEIHPNSRGYEKIASKLSARVRQLL